MSLPEKGSVECLNRKDYDEGDENRKKRHAGESVMYLKRVGKVLKEHIALCA